jgi:hypothetical protein
LPNRRWENWWRQFSRPPSDIEDQVRKRSIHWGDGRDDWIRGFLEGSNLAAVIRAHTTQICHIVKNNTLDVPFIFISAKKLAAYKALLDSGTTENFIDPRMVAKLEIGKVPMINPKTVFNVDGMENQGG